MAKTKAKRLLSLLLSLAMVMSLIVTPAFAITSAVDGSEVTDDGSDTNELNSVRVASITSGGTTYNYSTLAEAVEAAADGATITLTDNTTESASITIASGKSITLDLSGYTVDMGSYTVISCGTLTIQDSTATTDPVVSTDYETVTYTSGKITSTGTAVCAQSGGTVNLKSGTVESTGNIALYAEGDKTGATEVTSTINMTGGYAVAQEYTASPQGNGATLNISGGVLVAKDNAVIGGNGTNTDTDKRGGTTITISGGTLIGHIQTSGYVACGIYHPQSGTLTITGGTIYADGGCGILMRGGTLNMTGGTIVTTEASATGRVGDSRVVVDASGIIYDLDSGYYDVSNVTISLSGNVTINSADGAVTVVADTSTYTSGITVTGGTYSSDVSSYVATDYTATEGEDNTYTVASNYAASIGSTKYETLAEAINDASSGDTVTLLKNVTLTDTINIYKSITLALGDFTITSTADGKAIYTTQSLTITADKGGITATDVAIMNHKGQGTGTLTIDGGTYTSSGGHAIYNNNGTVIVKSGTITTTADSKDGICCYATATVDIQGGTITGTRYGIYNPSTLTVTGGTISSTCKDSKAGVYLSACSEETTITATISGGTISGYEGLKDAGATSVTITGGTFTGTTHAVNVGSSNVTVTGGTFTATGTYAQYAVAFYLDGATVTFSGGEFSGMYSTAWIKSESGGEIKYATGYGAVDSEGKTASLTANNSSGSDPLVRYVKLVSAAASVTSGEIETQYGTLEEAFAAAESGDTITLLANTTVDSQVVVSKEVTLDLAGYTISRGSCENSALIRVTSGGELTVKDSSTSGNGAIDGNINFTTTSGTTYAGIGLQVTSGGEATISGGTLSGYYGLYVGSSATVTMTGGTATGYIAAYVSSATLTASGGAITAMEAEPTSGSWYYGIQMSGSANVILSDNVTVTATCDSEYYYGAGVVLFGSGEEDGSNPTLTIKGGTITAKSYGISGNGSSDYTTINISGGTISATSEGGAGIYHPQTGTLTVTGESGAVNISGAMGIQMCDGTLTVGQDETDETYGDTYTTYNARITISGWGTNSLEGKTGDGAVCDGAAISVVNRLASAGYGTPTVTIYGGSFTSTNGDAVSAYTWSSNSDSDWEDVSDYINISGGSYSSEVDPDYCADGYTPATLDGTTGTYTVVEFYLGISTDSAETEESVPATVMSEKDGVMYVKVSATNISSNYTTSAYPTTDETWASTNNNDSGSYIFAGWYTLSDGSYTACTSDMWDSASEDAYYAKFVDANVLSVICVYTPASVTGSYPAWRFVSSLDSGNHDVFYFCVGNTTNTITTYYSSSTVGSVNKEFTKTDFSTASEYVTSYGFVDNATTPATTYTVKAGWKTSDGTTVYGTAYSFDASSCTAATILYGVAGN